MEQTNRQPISAGRVWLARGIAVAADVLQIAVFPAFAQGIASPLDAGLDVVVALLLVLLVGWHIAFLPTFLIEALPFVDLAPTWTLAVLIATRSAKPPKPIEDPRPVLPRPEGDQGGVK